MNLNTTVKPDVNAEILRLADSVTVTIAAIVSIAAIVVAALLTGNDGILAGTALATISGLAGVGIGFRMGRSRRG